jgi:hypothetical protein
VDGGSVSHPMAKARGGARSSCKRQYLCLTNRFTFRIILTNFPSLRARHCCDIFPIVGCKPCGHRHEATAHTSPFGEHGYGWSLFLCLELSYALDTR